MVHKVYALRAKGHCEVIEVNEFAFLRMKALGTRPMHIERSSPGERSQDVF